MPKEMGGAEIQTRSQMTIRRDLNGFAYVGDWRVEKTEAFPGAHGKMTWSYNTPSKKFWEFAVDDTGSVMRGESDGEQGGKMVWNEEGTMMGKPSKMRSTIVKKDKQSIEMTFESQDDGGSWKPEVRSCRHAPASREGLRARRDAVKPGLRPLSVARSPEPPAAPAEAERVPRTAS
jgi:hypothetical protein